ncbi:UDP-N-acetylmuramoyl-tripeptide--D-alanyl-D-alanine ligase [Curvibacter sp. AEP1-3]|uniref:hypothetical protein n=1 Tax=Curvibacter sp. AEP1-3 TaxID=1844971 RepID=UPI000B56E89A|nr:hypothetical protein [Curvibacter sp. AEP1-3]ARV19554.1 UDP-N-acetylmuramoyl-tripeptide--D-alanyl-D-alanine ligase [Curvibacter sp. AEP1-3]
MHRVPIVRRKPLWLAAFALCALAGSVSAQQTPQAPVEQGSIDWRKANDEVSQFKRGHADVLKWESVNDNGQSSQPYTPPDTWIKSADEAVRQAWRTRPELIGPLSQLGVENRERIAQGRWLEVDPAVRRRVEDFDTVMDVAADARKAWVTAVAASLTLKQQRDMQEATAAAAELARRMVRVGNWSRMEQAQWQAKLGKTKLQTLKAEIEAKQAQTALLKATKLWGVFSTVGLADAMPDMPQQALSPAALQQGLSALRNVQPRAESLKTGPNAQLAFDIYNASYQATQVSKDELTLQQFINDEVVLRYNGMLLSVWDLLTQTNELLQAQIGAINAQRDFLIAETDLQLVLQGGAPTSFVSLGGAGGESAAAK